MSFLGKEIPTSDRNLASVKKTTLNPNAAEFIPFSLALPSGNTANKDLSNFADASTATGKSQLDRSESSVSNNSDDEVRQYWRCRLPDDITPDFEVLRQDEDHPIDNLPFSNLSLTDITNTSRLTASTGSAFMTKEEQGLLPHQINGTRFAENTTYPASCFTDDASTTSFNLLSGQDWEKQLLNNQKFLANAREAPPYDLNSRNDFITDMFNEQPCMGDLDINPVEFLASQFPGFASESLAEVYYANGGDLNLTIEMLSQLEQQIDCEMNRNSKTLPTPNLNAMDFPALSVVDNENSLLDYSGDNLQQDFSSYRLSGKGSTISTIAFKSVSSPPRDSLDFASAVKKMPPQNPSIWKPDKHGSNDARVGSSRSSHGLTSPYNGSQSRGLYGDGLQSRGGLTRAAPVWLETGETVANMYTEMREEARDHARLRNAYFEQARQAYLTGQKALAKELSAKGQLHNMKMKDAHSKAQESIFRLRNPEMSPNVRGRERIIDLHGLHVSEAIHVLKRELSVLRNAARSTDQRLQVFICVGTGHHTKGSRTPARLPTAVQRHLLEEGLDFSEPQPGLLRVVIY